MSLETKLKAALITALIQQNERLIEECERLQRKCDEMLDDMTERAAKDAQTIKSLYKIIP